MCVSELIRCRGLSVERESLYKWVWVFLYLSFYSWVYNTVFPHLLLLFCILWLYTYSHFIRKRLWLMTEGHTFFSPQWNQRGSSAWEHWIEGKPGSQAGSIKSNAVLKDPVCYGYSKDCITASLPNPTGAIASYTQAQKGGESKILLAWWLLYG